MLHALLLLLLLLFSYDHLSYGILYYHLKYICQLFLHM